MTTSTGAADALVDTAAAQTRTRWVLIGSVLPAGMGMAAGFAASSLAAKDITDNDALSTLAATMIAIGAAIAAVPLGRYMARHGRRPGLFAAWVVGGFGALCAFLAVVWALYPLLLVGVVGIGVGQAANLAARYAAADLAEPHNRGRDIGIVVWASSIGAVLGPSVALDGTGRVATWLGLDELAGPYLMGVLVFAVASVVVHLRLRPDPLLLAQQAGAAPTGHAMPASGDEPTGGDELACSPEASSPADVAKSIELPSGIAATIAVEQSDGSIVTARSKQAAGSRPEGAAGPANQTAAPKAATGPSLRESFARLAGFPPAAVAVFAMALGQAVMVAIMTVTPLHMDDGNHEVRVIGYVISLHIVGMFMLAPLVGWVVDRLLPGVMVAAAGLTLFVGGEMASHTDPEDSAGVFVGLFLVGLGWSIATLSGSALLTASFSVEERAAVQGAADFTMVAAGALAGLSSGVIVEAWDFHFLSHWAGVSALALVAAGLYPLIKRRSSTPHPRAASDPRSALR